MKYEPKILFNPTDKVIEFMCDGMVYVFEPGEKRNLDGFVAYHALRETNTGLKEYSIEDGEEVSVSSVAYDKLPWLKLVSIASEREIFTPGMKKKEVIKALIELDEQETGTLQEPSN